MPKLPKILGYNLDKLPPVFKSAKVGEIESAKIKTRGSEDPVHRSEYNKKDTNEILSVQIKPLSGVQKTHHVYADGTGTLKLGDKREFSTSAGKRE
ncbi:hypothetical protein TI39_contig592g00013 [Zymoseptoria brevis]|uniref:Uncharacterized protein n=1 Tax=Zymoseptoria brevis TaxID=1047168 RepID=A0A0F4GHT1_9PEZI|nr:hypothetical protein TI39_contig592g00013 [Zymoseptoria brevis]